MIIATLIASTRRARRIANGSTLVDVAGESVITVGHPLHRNAPRLTRIASNQDALRWTSQTAVPMSNRASANSQPPSIHWKVQNRLAGW